MQLPSRMPKSRPTSGKTLESAASVEVRRLLVRLESKRTRECRAQTSPLDRKVVRRCNRFVAIVARVPLHARVNRRVGQTRSIQLDKLLHTPVRVRSFVDRNKTCT